MIEKLVIDASVAVKWVVEEEGSADALAVRKNFRCIAPELMIAEVANILWKKVQRKELLIDEARLAARLLEQSGIEFVTMHGALEPVTELAARLAHPAYDCIYLELAQRRDLRFVTADIRLLRAISERGSKDLSGLCVALSAIGASLH